MHRLGDKRRAESEPLKRQERVEQLDIVPLSAQQQNAYLQQWRAVQAYLVDDPKRAVTERWRGGGRDAGARLSIAEFEQRVRTCRCITRTPSRTTVPRMTSGSATAAARGRRRISARRWSTIADCSRISSRIASTPSARCPCARAIEERVVERTVERDADRLEIPVKHTGDRASDGGDRATTQ